MKIILLLVHYSLKFFVVKRSAITLKVGKAVKMLLWKLIQELKRFTA